MSRAGISEASVAAAVKTLTDSGEKATIKAIRSLLGSGSPNTIHKHLKALEATTPVKEATTPTLPPALEAALVKEISFQVTEGRLELQLQLTQSQEDIAQLATEGEKLESEIEKLTQVNTLLSKELQSFRALFQDRSSIVQELTTKLDTAKEEVEAARIEAAVSVALNVKLEADLKAQKQAFDTRIKELKQL